MVRCAQVLGFAAFILASGSQPSSAQTLGRFDILNFAPVGSKVDQTGHLDASQALAGAVNAANAVTKDGGAACIHIPAGRYLIATPPPQFARAGCVRGDGSTQSILVLDPAFTGDLFTWSESWVVTTPGPTVAGLRIIGDRAAHGAQNALVFYDRNDEVYLDDIGIYNLPGRALYAGATKHTDRAFIRESHFRSLRFFNDGAPDAPVIEFSSKGKAPTDATNEIRLSQVDIYGAHGPGFVIRNDGDGAVRAISAESLRIEGAENGTIAGDLITIGDPVMRGSVNTISFSNLELIDPYPGYAALRLTAAPGAPAPFFVTAQGWIGGGLPNGEGLRIDAGRRSDFHFSDIHTRGANVTIGRGVRDIVLDGDGGEACWTYTIDATSLGGIRTPAWAVGSPASSVAEAPPGVRGKC